jgi:hypothetical protein
MLKSGGAKGFGGFGMLGKGFFSKDNPLLFSTKYKSVDTSFQSLENGWFNNCRWSFNGSC